MQPVSRAYEKLKFAIEKFKINLNNKICADFGSSTGGFVQVILENGCKKVYSVETSKNRLHFVLKDDERVIVLDSTNAIHVKLPEKVDFISIDVGWTKQKLIIPNAIENLKDDGIIISLIKPHYESGIRDVREECLIREIKEEHKVELIPELINFFGEFEDIAANEPDTIISMKVYLGEILGKPLINSEIEEQIWFVKTDNSEILSPIIKNKILPELIKNNLI